MTPSEYEQVTKSLVESIVEQVEDVGSYQVKQGRTNHWTGVSGFAHQIDVSVESLDDLLLIECKRWTESVDVPSFLTFLARVIDIRETRRYPHIHASVVTTKNFESGVTRLAAYYKVDLHKVSSPVEFAIRYKQLFAIGVKDELNRWADSIQIEPN